MLYGIGAHSDCTRKANCTSPHQSRIKAEGLRWATAYELARRGGLTSVKRIEPHDVDGYLQSIRGGNYDEINRAISGGETGTGMSRHIHQRRNGPSKDDATCTNVETICTESYAVDRWCAVLGKNLRVNHVVNPRHQWYLALAMNPIWKRR